MRERGRERESTINGSSFHQHCSVPCCTVSKKSKKGKILKIKKMLRNKAEFFSGG
jgi:hypothetical protein